MEDSLNYPVCLTITLCLLILASKFLQSRRTKKQSKNPAPSPTSLPIIGHLHLLKAPLHRSAQRLAQKHGPVVALRFGSSGAVLISSPEAVEECFTKNDVVLANRPRLVLSRHIGYNQTTMTTAPYGDHWRNLRRIAAIEIFSAARLKSFAATRKAVVHSLLLELYRRSSGRVEMKSLLAETTFNVISRMVAGEDESEDRRDEGARFRRVIKEVVSTVGVANPGEFLPFLEWFGEGYERKVKGLAEKTDKLLQALIDRFRRKKDKENTMIDHLLSLQESQPEYYTDAIIKGLVLVLLTAGTDTSAVTLEWAMSNLLNHPDVLNKAKAEIDHKVGFHRLVDDSDLPKLDCLQSIISETLRLYPAAPLLVPHFSSEDFTVCGYHVPRDTIVLVNAWSIHRDPAVWGNDAEEFRPERFEAMGDLAHKLMPFGQGRRACPGAGLAQRVVGLALASMIQCFEWDRVGEQRLDMSEGRGVTMPKAVPLEGIFKARPILVDVLLSPK